MLAGNQKQPFGQLIELIYDSVQDMQKMVPVMKMMCRELGAVSAHYLHLDVQRREVLASCLNHDDYRGDVLNGRQYDGHFSARLGRLSAGELGEWRADHPHVDEVRPGAGGGEDGKGDFWFKDGGGHMVVGCIAEEAGQAEAIALLRPLGAPQYSEQEYQFLGSLSPHLMRSASLRARLRSLEREQSVSESVVAHLPYGTARIDLAGRIISMNFQARKILAAADGLSVRHDRLLAHDADAAERLASALHMAIANTPRQGQWFALVRRQQNIPLLVSVIPENASQALDPLGGGPFALLILQDMTRQRVSCLEQLQIIYRLTPAERRLAEALLENETVESYSLKSSVSRNTVRTHLASLFAKTGTKRQAELISTLLASQPHVIM